MYPQDILFQATQDKCSLLDSIKVQDQIEVSFNLRGREWTSPTGEVKYFNSLEAWRIEVLDESDTEKAVVVEKLDINDDLPF